MKKQTQMQLVLAGQPEHALRLSAHKDNVRLILQSA